AGKPAGKPLAVYYERRNFGRTPEPRGTRARAARDGRLSYVVQKHDATRLHYDFRLEHDGVLKSWAVPKEPTLTPSARHLAVQTEDHPLEYGAFEGEIPKGEYGAGSVVIWDRGVWQPEGDVARGLRDGKLSFALDGERLSGRWTLVRMARKDTKRKAPDNWLLIKRSDAPNRKAETKKTVTKKARGKVRPNGDDAQAAHSSHASRSARTAQLAPAVSAKTVPGARRAPLPARVSPQLATLVAAPVQGPEWLHEQKLDGYRLLCRIERGRVTLTTRRGHDWTARFPHIAAAAAELECSTPLLDGEAVVFDERGVTSLQRFEGGGGRVTLTTRRGNDWAARFPHIAAAAAELECSTALLAGEAVVFDERGVTSFQRLQGAIGRGDPDIVFVAFDLLYLEGYDLRGVP